MKLFVAYSLQIVLLLLPWGSNHCSAGPLIVGTPPSFVEQPSDTVVHETVSYDINGVPMNLVLHCLVTGSPTPSVSWFRGNANITDQGLLLSNGTIGLNITEGPNGASRDGVAYHCTATNIIGPENATATIRSRDANVSYAFFGGFDNGTSSTVVVQVVLNQPAALECKVRPSNPPPIVQWRYSGTIVLSTGNSMVSIEDGRYLFIASVKDSSPNRLGEYGCEVTNALIDDVRVSPTTYNVMNDLLAGTVVTYKPIGDLVGSVGEILNFLYVGGYRSSSGSFNDGLTLRCTIPGFIPSTAFTSTGLRVLFTVPSPDEVGGTNKVTIQCNRLLVDSNVDGGSVNGTLNIVSSANITNPTIQSPDLIQRGTIAGGPSVILKCDRTGLPGPSLRWFYNGGPIPGSSGVSANGPQVTIPTPQVVNSGIYQCFVSNGVEGALADRQRTWIVEVTTPKTPTIESLTSTNDLAVADRIEGTVLVLPFNTTDLVLRVQLDSNPCPNIQWQFNGENVTTSNAAFTFNDPCADDNNFSPYDFNFTIANLTSATSGSYSALFNNGFSTEVPLPGFYVTIPVETAVQAISLQIENAPGAECLLAGSTAVLTCVIDGFPRPRIEFLKESVTIVPASSERISNISFDQIQISNIDRTDEGLYSCQAYPVTGGLLQLATPLQFPYCTRPVITSVTSNLNVVEGDQLEVECDFTSIPFPEVSWLKDDQPLTGQGDGIRISTSRSNNTGQAIVTIVSATLSNNGMYTCIIKNPAASVNRTVEIQVTKKDTAILTTTAIIGIAAGAAGLVLIIVLLILLLICVFLCAKRSKSVDFHPYNVDTAGDDYKDGRGNVDADSVDGNVPPEEFDPDYASLPTTRPNEPPPYKATPGYGHGGPLEGDDLEMVKYPPQDSESFVAGGYSRQQEQYRPTPDDFLSEDAQFV